MTDVQCLRHTYNQMGYCRRCGDDKFKNAPRSSRPMMVEIPKGRGLTAGTPDRARYMAALQDQMDGIDRKPWLRGGIPTPERITVAIDLGGPDCKGLGYGPDVDAMFNVEEPTVDLWEAGLLVPTVDQVRLIARVTGFPMKFFYLPPPAKVQGGFICGTDGCVPMDDSTEPSESLL
jgi:hypothetical protein